MAIRQKVFCFCFFTSGGCDVLCTMILASFTYGLGVLCVVLTTVVAGEKLQFVFRIFLLSIKVNC